MIAWKANSNFYKKRKILESHASVVNGLVDDYDTV